MMENINNRVRTDGCGGGGGGGGAGCAGKGKQQQAQAEGERILAPTRRPDGTLRKPIRIRAGYVPQDEVAIYQSKGALLRKSSETPDVPPGYDPKMATKTKCAKRNERKKEKKKLLAAISSSDEKGQNLDQTRLAEMEDQVAAASDHPVVQGTDPVDTITSQMNGISISSTNSSLNADQLENCDSSAPGNNIDKKIRALKKKIRLAEMQQNASQQHMKPEQLEKLAKVKVWCEELRTLEDKQT